MRDIAVCTSCLIGVVAIASAHCGAARAQEPGRDGKSAKNGPTLEQQLLEDLNAKPAPPALRSEKGGSDFAPNPLAQIAQRMRTAERRLAGRETSRSTQELQRQIVDDLARLLAQSGQPSAASGAEKGTGRDNAQAPPGAADPLPSAAARSASSGERGEFERAQQANLNEWLDQMWGHLPEKVRNQMRAPRSEQFLPKYERTIEEYYLRLAEEQAASR